MSDVHIDASVFRDRISTLQKKLSGDKSFQNVDSILILVGSANEDNPYQKSSILQTWLLGYEFPATALLITKTKVVILTSINKAKHLNPLEDASTLIWTRNKDPENNAKLFNDLIKEIEENGSKVGHVAKDSYKGKFIDEWEAIFNPIKSKFELLDISPGLSSSMEIKDEEEQKNLRLASKASITMMNFFTNEMIRLIDDEIKISNSKLSDKIENKIDDANWLKENKKKLGQDFDINQLDWCYTPIVQSGGKYDLKPSAQSNDDQLTGGVILSSLGLRYKSYCSNVGRTFLIDPSKEIEANYDFLLLVQEKIFSFLKDGISAKDLYGKAIKFIQEKRPDLEKNFIKNIGWLIGLEFRDSTFLINGKSERTIHDGSVLNITIGFNNLENSVDKKNYSLILTDTVRVTGSEPIILTSFSKSRSEISYYFKDEDDTANKSKSSSNKKTELKSENKIKIEKNIKATEANSKILKSKLRGETKNQEEDQERLKQELQKQLHAKRQQEGLARFSTADATEDSVTKAVFKKYESYVRESQIPTSVKDLRLHVDYKNNTIIVPICGRPVPFHINAFKNGSKTDEGEYTSVRLNFNCPGAGGNVSKKTELPYEDTPGSQFVKSISIRSKDHERISETFKLIMDLKKDSTKREAEKKQLSDVVTQDNLVEIKGSRVKRLDSVYIRPGPDSKKAAGQLQIHENGLRYISTIRSSDSRTDILFSNIKHLFFQPCKDELIVLIHCHLKNPIMIGKKKCHDVQFYREASDIGYDETGGKKRKYRYGDEDELEQEQEERKKKALLDKEFKAFAEQISDSSNGLIDVDIPFRELGFTGVPFRSSVLCMPTRDCLVQLIDSPFLVVTLEEIEIAHLERVQFGLKNFDLVFVFRNFSKPVVHINTIPMELLEDVKSWLTDVDIPLSEGAVNLNWPTIMKTVQADPRQFFEDGGWSFLGGDSEDEEESEEEESEFEVSDDDPSDEDIESEGSFSDESASASEEESDGEDWDELENKAAKADRNAGAERY